jgi:tetratricopeptide (TPR) repeat protein
MRISASCVRLAATALLACTVAGAAGCANPDDKARGYTASGDAYAAKQQYKEAVIEYRRALAETPNAADVRYKLGRAYQESGDLVNAYTEYARAGDLDPSNLDAQMRAGTILLLGREFGAAARRAELALKVDSRYVPAHILLGNARAGLNDTTQAMREIQEAIKIDPSYAPAWTALGAVTFIGGRKADAAPAFKKAVELAPRSIEARLALANYEWATGAFAGAERTLESALKIEPQNAAAHRALALLYITTNRRDEAEPHFRALAVDGAGRLALADYYMGVGRNRDAVNLLEELQKSPEKSDVREARLRIASIEYAAGKKVEAHRIVDELIAERSRYAAARTAKARMLLNDGAPPSEAVAQAREAVKADPYLPAAHYTLGLAAFADRNLDEAAKAFEEAVKLGSQPAAARMQLARVKLAQGDAAGAVSIAELAANARPSDTDAAVLLAQTLRASGNPNRAAGELTSRLASGRGNEAPLHTELGWVELQRGDASAARAAFFEALRAAPRSTDVRKGIIAAQLADRRIDAARKQIAEWETASSTDPRVKLLSAQVELAAGNTAGAEQTLKAVIAGDASQLDAYDLLARVYVRQGRVEEAVQQYEALAERAPAGAAGARTMIGMLNEARKDREGARRAYEQALTSDPHAGVAANNLAWIYAEDGKLDQALRLATTAQASLRRRPEAEDTLGWIYLQKGLTSQAIAAFERARERAPQNPVYHYHLGLAHLKSGDNARARTAFERALKLQPDFAHAADARAQLASMDDAGDVSQR